MANITFYETSSSSRKRGWILVATLAATAIFSYSTLTQLTHIVHLQRIHELPYHIDAQIDTSHNFIAANTKHDAILSSSTTDGAQRHQRGDGGVANRDDNEKASIDRSASDNTIDFNTYQDERERKKTAVIEAVRYKKPKTTTPRENQQPQLTRCSAAAIMPNTDFWGEALVPGPSNKKNSVEECCKSCSEYKSKSADAVDCNVFVFCADQQLCGTQYKDCWLKHLAHPDGTAPSNQGPLVGWTTGLMQKRSISEEELAQTAAAAGSRKYHVVITAQGPATHWQSRIHYYWYKKIKKQCEAQGKCDMGGFTRILHSGEADDLMNEIPTYVAQPLPPEHPHHGYIVLNRPWAFVQWLRDATIPEDYVLMSEPDHVWLKPMPNVMIGDHAAAFPFFYIEPSKKEYLPLVQKFVGEPLTRKESEQIAPIGNAPTLMRLKDLSKVVPLWYNLSLAVHNDEKAVKEWGWVQEMYAFTLSVYKAGLRDVGLHIKMMSQPPFDTNLEPYYLLHFTYGMDYNLDGQFTPGKYGEWRFDKRSYSQNPPPRNLSEPPEKMENELVRHLIHALNEATSAIPGWDEYERTGVASRLWDGQT